MSRAVAIGAGEAHLWTAAPADLERAGLLVRYASFLSPAEDERARRFVFPQDRLAFLAAHGLARAALSACVPAVPPRAWTFALTDFGRPEIATPTVEPTVRFNISHARQLVACLVVVQADCGVDVEALDRATDVLGLAEQVLSATERVRLLALPRHARPELLLRYWTLKEAYVKARGRGLSLPLRACAFEIGPEAITAAFDASLDDDAAAWQFAQWSAAPKHVLAVALRRGDAVRYRIVRHDPPAGRDDLGALAMPSAAPTASVSGLANVPELAAEPPATRPPGCPPGGCPPHHSSG